MPVNIDFCVDDKVLFTVTYLISFYLRSFSDIRGFPKFVWINGLFESLDTWNRPHWAGFRGFSLSAKVWSICWVKHYKWELINSVNLVIICVCSALMGNLFTFNSVSITTAAVRPLSIFPASCYISCANWIKTASIAV